MRTASISSLWGADGVGFPLALKHLLARLHLCLLGTGELAPRELGPKGNPLRPPWVTPTFTAPGGRTNFLIERSDERLDDIHASLPLSVRPNGPGRRRSEGHSLVDKSTRVRSLQLKNGAPPGAVNVGVPKGRAEWVSLWTEFPRRELRCAEPAKVRPRQGMFEGQRETHSGRPPQRRDRSRPHTPKRRRSWLPPPVRRNSGH